MEKWKTDLLADVEETVFGLGPCAACGHDPACGFSSVSRGDTEEWYCHTNDHSCYEAATRREALSDFILLVEEAQAAR